MTAPKVGVGSYAYRWSIGIGDRVPPRPLSATRLLERVAKLGASVLQFADNLPLHEVGEAEVQALAVEARERGVALEIGTHGASGQNLARYLALARSLGATVVRLSLDEADLARPRDELAASLRDAAASYGDAHCVLAIENHFAIPTDELVALFDAVDHPAVGACVDVANSIALLERPAETIARLAPYALSLHLKDFRVEIDAYGVGLRLTGVPLGEGETDLDAVFATLEGSGRSPNVILEHWLPYGVATAGESMTDVEDDWTRRSLEVARAHLARSSRHGNSS